MTRLLQNALISGLTASTDILLGRQFTRRLETMQRNACAPVSTQISLFATGTPGKRLFH